MKKTLLNKFTLKILSVVIAIFVWLLVVNIEDPIIERPIANVPVKLTNESYIESTGKVPRIKDEKSLINVTITGKRSIVEKVKAENITAVADLTQIIDINSDPIMVPIMLSCPGITESNIKARPQNMEVVIEEMESMDWNVIAVNKENSKPAKGYDLGSLTSDPEKITISGPTSIVSKIDRVTAPVDITGKTQDDDIITNLEIIDKNQEILSTEQMKFLKFSIAQPTVKVHVDLWEIKTDIPITVKYEGKPARGYQVAEVISTPSKIAIAGSDEALAAFKEAGNMLEIPSRLVQVDGESQDFEVKVEKLAELFPEGMELKPVTDGDTKLLITVKILPLNSKELSLSSTSIAVNNQPEGLDAVLGTEKVAIRIKAKDEALAQFTEANLMASVDLKNLAAGEYEVPITIQLPEGYELVDNVVLKVKLVKAADKTAGK